jgi:hypothetical protein
MEPQHQVIKALRFIETGQNPRGKTQGRASKKKTKLTNRDTRLSDMVIGWRRMGNHTISLRPPAAQYANKMRHQFDRLVYTGISATLSFTTLTLMIETEISCNSF